MQLQVSSSKQISRDESSKSTFFLSLSLSPSLTRHHNRDAVLAHVKIHYQETSYPKSTSSGSSTSPLQVSVGSNQQQLYMNKVFAAMCLSQPSPTGSSSVTVGGNQQQQQHSLISAGLLQRAIQEAQHSPTPNSSALSGLALALAGGKCPSTTTSTPKANAASILEHGEQKASQNEASADSLTSPTITSSSTAARSLQDLLTSPRTRHGHHFGAGASPSTTTATACPSGSAQTNQNNANCYNSVVVMGGSAGSSNSNGTRYHLESRKSLNASSTNTAPNSINNTPSPMPVTTTPTPISTFPTGAKSLVHSLGTGLSSSNSNSNNNNNSTSNLTDTHPHNPLIAGDGIYLATGLTHALHSTNLKSKLSSTSSSLLSASASASSSSASQASAASSPHSSPPSSSSYMPQAMTGPTTRLHSPGSPGLLTMNDADRRDPSPYRCGHCHQLSNWKHVIQVFV